MFYYLYICFVHNLCVISIKILKHVSTKWNLLLRMRILRNMIVRLIVILINMIRLNKRFLNLLVTMFWLALIKLFTKWGQTFNIRGKALGQFFNSINFCNLFYKLVKVTNFDFIFFNTTNFGIHAFFKIFNKGSFIHIWFIIIIFQSFQIVNIFYLNLRFSNFSSAVVSFIPTENCNLNSSTIRSSRLNLGYFCLFSYQILPAPYKYVLINDVSFN